MTTFIAHSYFIHLYFSENTVCTYLIENFVTGDELVSCSNTPHMIEQEGTLPALYEI